MREIVTQINWMTTNNNKDSNWISGNPRKKIIKSTPSKSDQTNNLLKTNKKENPIFLS